MPKTRLQLRPSGHHEFCKLTACVRVVGTPEHRATPRGLPFARARVCRHQGPDRPAWVFTLTAYSRDRPGNARAALLTRLLDLQPGDRVKVHGALHYYEYRDEAGRHVAGHDLIVESLTLLDEPATSIVETALRLGAERVDDPDEDARCEPPAAWVPGHVPRLT
jgi:hypothetical protein